MNTTTKQHQRINVKKEGSFRNFLIHLIAISATITIIFPNFSMAGTSPAIILLIELFIFNILIFQQTQQLILPKPVFKLILIYILFCIAMTISFILTGAITTSDIKYLSSLYGNSVWIFLISLSVYKSKHFLREFLRLFIPSVFLFLVFGFIFFILLYGNLFFIRHDTSDLFIREISIFKNANYFARFSLSILVIITLNYLFLKSGKSVPKRSFYIMSATISILILLSESRTNLFALIIFWVGLIPILKRKHNFSTPMILKKLLIAFLMVGVILSIPDVNDRIINGLGKMISSASSNASGVDLPIRLRTWFASVEIFQDFPIFGIGFSRMEDIMIYYDAVKYIGKNEVSAVQIHGGFLKILNFGGLFALVPFLFFIFFNFRLASIGIKKALLPEGIDLYKLWILFLTLLIISNISADSFGVPHTWITLSLLISASASNKKLNHV